MTSLEEWHVIKNLEKSAERNSMRVTQAQFGKKLALVPDTKMEALPGYEKDYQLCTGTAEELNAFIHGWENSRYYLSRLKVLSAEQINEAESLILQDRTESALRYPPKLDK